MFLLFNMLSGLVIAFLSGSKHLLISWLQSPSAVIWELKKIKSVTISIVSPSICHELRPDTMLLVFWPLSFKPAFSLLIHLHQEALLFFFAFCHQGDVICISEVIDTSLGNLDSSLWFIQLWVTSDIHKWQDTDFTYSFPNFELRYSSNLSPKTWGAGEPVL